jgi:hypothetical protein
MKEEAKQHMDILWAEMRTWESQWDLLGDVGDLKELVTSFEKIEEDSYEDFFENIMENGEKIFTVENSLKVAMLYFLKQPVLQAWKFLHYEFATRQENE